MLCIIHPFPHDMEHMGESPDLLTHTRLYELLHLVYLDGMGRFSRGFVWCLLDTWWELTGLFATGIMIL